jgi:hypothetical protein
VEGVHEKGGVEGVCARVRLRAYWGWLMPEKILGTRSARNVALSHDVCETGFGSVILLFMTDRWTTPYGDVPPTQNQPPQLAELPAAPAVRFHMTYAKRGSVLSSSCS